MQWHYAKNGTQLGPIHLEELKAKLASGEVSPADLVWRNGMTDWRKAGQVPELALHPAATIAPVGQQPHYSSVGAVSIAPYSQVAIPAASVVPVSTHPAFVSSHSSQDVPSYMWQSILVMLFCCVPTGIVALIHAARVDTLRSAGNESGALAASGKAKKWCILSVVLAVLLWGGVAGGCVNYFLKGGKMPEIPQLPHR